MTTGVAILWHAAAEKTSKSLMFHLSAPSDKRMDSLRCICAIRAAMLRQGCPLIRVTVKRKPATQQKKPSKKKGRCKNMVYGGGGVCQFWFVICVASKVGSLQRNFSREPKKHVSGLVSCCLLRRSNGLSLRNCVEYFQDNQIMSPHGQFSY